MCVVMNGPVIRDPSCHGPDGRFTSCSAGNITASHLGFKKDSMLKIYLGGQSMHVKITKVNKSQNSTHPDSITFKDMATGFIFTKGTEQVKDLMRQHSKREIQTGLTGFIGW